MHNKSVMYYKTNITATLQGEMSMLVILAKQSPMAYWLFD